MKFLILIFSLLFQIERMLYSNPTGVATPPPIPPTTPELIFIGDSQTSANGIQPRIINCLNGASCSSATPSSAWVDYTYANGGISISNMAQFNDEVESYMILLKYKR